MTEAIKPQPLSSFHLFPPLPTELQIIIFTYACLNSPSIDAEDDHLFPISYVFLQTFCGGAVKDRFRATLLRDFIDEDIENRVSLIGHLSVGEAVCAGGVEEGYQGASGERYSMDGGLGDGVVKIGTLQDH